MDRQPLAILRRAFVSWLILLLPPLAAFGRDNTPVASVDVDQLLLQGRQFEKSGDWSRAVQLYENASKSHPNSPLLRERLRHCTIRYGLSRRYHDTSYRKKMLGLSRGQAAKLYDEVLRRIEESYVEPMSPGKMFRSGVDGLMIACEDAQFLKTNIRSTGEPQRLDEFRDLLRQWRTMPVRDRGEAVQFAAKVAEQAQMMMDITPAPVILEFVYGACDSLDDYSTCLTPDRLSDLYSVIDGNFVGIGVELRSDDQGLLIVNTLTGSPAAEAGIRGGDHIVTIDGISTVGLPTEDAANRLQGTEGTTVQVGVLSPNDRQPHRLTLRRRSVEVLSVTNAQMLSSHEGIGYLQITGFQKSTTVELEKAVSALQRQGLRSLVIDLRGNPGGLLTSAVDISDRFLNDGVIVSTRGRAEGQSQTYRAQPSHTWTFPLVLLIDGESASASEILAGAIQDHHRGTIVGTRSFGKGSVQSIFPLDTVEAGIRLTTAKFFSPRGRAYAHQGVSPDIAVERSSDWRPVATTMLQVDTATDPQLAAALQASRQLLSRRVAN